MIFSLLKPADEVLMRQTCGQIERSFFSRFFHRLSGKGEIWSLLSPSIFVRNPRHERLLFFYLVAKYEINPSVSAYKFEIKSSSNLTFGAETCYIIMPLTLAERPLGAVWLSRTFLTIFKWSISLAQRTNTVKTPEFRPIIEINWLLNIQMTDKISETFM